MIKSMITPPSSRTTHVLFGAGLKGETTLKLAVMGKKEDIFDQKDYPCGEVRKAKKVRNFYVYYRTNYTEAIGFSRDENIRFHHKDGMESYDYRDVNGRRNATPPKYLHDHRLCIATLCYNLNVIRCGKDSIRNTTIDDFKSKYRTVF